MPEPGYPIVPSRNIILYIILQMKVVVWSVVLLLGTVLFHGQATAVVLCGKKDTCAVESDVFISSDTFGVSPKY